VNDEKANHGGHGGTQGKKHGETLDASTVHT
jgi:hypothetical protein